MRKLFRFTPAVAALALHLAAPAAIAGEDDCCFHITPYLWAFGIDGDIQTHGEDVNVSADFDDIVDNLDLGGSVLLEANAGRWASYAMLDYLSLDTGDVETRRPGVDADLEMESTLATIATGYRFQSGERSTVDLQVGLRYAQFDNQLKLQGIGQRDSDNSIYDAIVALRPHIALTKYWYFNPTMSVGAGDSDLTWELSPQFVYECCGFDVRLGYRSLNYDFEKGGDSADITIHGPMIGIGFAF